MKNYILMLIIGFISIDLSASHIKNHPDHIILCSFDDGMPVDNIYVRAASNEAEAAIFNIVDVIGLYTQFEVKASNIPTAAATVINNKRYILYNERFMSALSSAAENDWISISILAHEIGHHLNGHTMDAGGLMHSKELEADEFSGYVLRKLGASVSDAQQALAIIANTTDTKSHPARAKRLDAIAKGWKKADVQMSGSYVAAPVFKREIEKNTYSKLAEQYIASRVHIVNAPDENYYITTGSNFVKESKNGIIILGKIQKNKSTKYPYAIINKQEEYILINEKGNLITKEGDVIGYLKS